MAIRHDSGNAAAHGAADWLCLAAAPTFAIMALLTGVLGGGAPDMLCSAAQDASPLSGMVPMYVLMSAFHAAPWLKLISSRRSGPSAWLPWSVSGPPDERRQLIELALPSAAVAFAIVRRFEHALRETHQRLAALFLERDGDERFGVARTVVAIPTRR